VALVFIHGEWEFTITSLTARKVNVVDNDYTGVATINIVNGVAHLEAMHCDEFTSIDARSFKTLVTQDLKLENYEFRRYENGILKTKNGIVK